MDNYIVSLVDDERIDKDFQVAKSKIESLQLELNRIYEEIRSLEPQQKIFVLDRLLAELCIQSQVPEFYLNSILLRTCEFVKNMNFKEITETISEDKRSYIG